MSEPFADYRREQDLRDACAELERRLLAGEDCRAEELLAAFPHLTEDPEAVLELLYVEYVSRLEAAPRRLAEDLGARFPQLREALRSQLRQHEKLLAVTGLSSHPPPEEEPGPPAATRPSWPPHYEEIGRIGEGNMGVVYRARQVRLDRVVALKMIRAGAHDGSVERARFRTEAEALARVQHPHIVQVFEVGEQDGQLYLALEYVDGRGLDRHLGGAAWPPDRAARLTATLARAVQHAHARGIVHRDLKPANILLTADGTPKIIDFGLARRLGGARQTQSGAVIGTASYMAPEQAADPRHAGPAADVYSLGAILYEMLTGRPPFKGTVLLETLEQVRTQEPAPPRRRSASRAASPGTSGRSFRGRGGRFAAAGAAAPARRGPPSSSSRPGSRRGTAAGR